MDASKSDGVPHTREYRLSLSRTVRMGESLFRSYLRIYDNRKEPVDVLYQFALLNIAMEVFDLMSILVLLPISGVLL